MTRSRCSSNTMPPQFTPPMYPGDSSVPRVSGGVKMPSLRSEAMSSRHLPRSQKVRPQASAGCTGRWEVSAGSDENGCVDQACSPGTWLAGTGLSMIGNSGCPRVRSNTYNMPVLVAWMTAGTGTPGDQDRRSEEHTSELQSPCNLVCRLLLEKKKYLLQLHTCDLVKPKQPTYQHRHTCISALYRHDVYYQIHHSHHQHTQIIPHYVWDHYRHD